MNIRETFLQLDARAVAIESWGRSQKIRNAARAQRVLIAEALDTLDNSREVTEKLTTWEVPHYVVTNHKARIVLDG